MWCRGVGSVVLVLVGINFLLVGVRAQIPNRYRLSKNARPTHYDLSMKIDVDTQKFNGDVKINVKVLNSTPNIQLHYKDMVVSSVQVKRGEEEVPLGSPNYSEETEIFSIPASSGEFPEGDYTLSMSFSSAIRTDKKGLYMSTYFDEDGEKYFIATTFMAPTYARMAFPCFDEPEYKANYTIHVTHASKYFALSNMPAMDPATDLGDGWTTTHFPESKPTSTYIVAFIVCDFEKKSRNDWPLSIYAQPWLLNDTAYALDHFNSVREALEDYVGRKFQYPKLDMIAIDDFLMGAMENWGIITYLSSRVLMNDATELKTLIAGSKTLSHEMAHQWFGNEVTHNYWNVVWLKEGLATVFEDLLTDVVHPDWRMWDQFVLNTMQFVMQPDSAFDVRTMMKTYETPAEIRAVYDVVTYKKAGSVMRMMMNVLTAPVFKQAMDYFIEENSFSTATNVDLARAFQKAVDESAVQLPGISSVFNSWINSPGFPVVTVTREYKNSKKVHLHQKRFISSYSSFATEIFVYEIPLNFATEDKAIFTDTSPQLWLAAREADFELQGLTDDKWVIFNKLATGYYRVNYDETNWGLINATLRKSFSQIPPSNRAQLIDDALNLARYGQLDYKIALDIVSYAKSEDDFVPLISLFNNLRDLERVARGSDLYLETFFVNLVQSLYANWNLEDLSSSKSDIDRLMHVEIVNFACRFGHPKCMESAFKMLMDTDVDIQSDFRSAVFCGGLQYPHSISDQMAAAAILIRLRMKSSSEGVRRLNDKEVNDLLSSISCIRSEYIMGEILEWTIKGAEDVYFESGDANKIFAAVASANSTGTKTALTFLEKNYQTISEKYESLPKIYEALAPNIVTVELKSQFEALVTKYYPSQPVDNKALKKALEAAKSLIIENMKWKELRVNPIKEYLYGSAIKVLLSPLAILCVILATLKNVIHF